MINLSGLWWSTDVLMNHKPLPPEPKKKRVEGDFKERLEREMNGQRIQSEGRAGADSEPRSLCQISEREGSLADLPHHEGDH